MLRGPALKEAADKKRYEDLLFGPPPFFACLYGSKHSGKSVIIKHTAYTYTHVVPSFHKVVIISGTLFNSSYDWCPEKWRHDEYQPKIIEDLMDEGKHYREKGRPYHVLLVLDDILGVIDFRKPERHKELVRLFSGNRHYMISILLATQTPRAVTPLIRQNVDFAVFLRSLQSAMDVLSEEYADRDKKDFTRLLMDGTTNYQFLLWSAREPGADRVTGPLQIPKSFLEKEFVLKA